MIITMFTTMFITMITTTKRFEVEININAAASEKTMRFLLPAPGPQLHGIEPEVLGLGVELLPAQRVDDRPAVQVDQAGAEHGLPVQHLEDLVQQLSGEAAKACTHLTFYFRHGAFS